MTEPQTHQRYPLSWPTGWKRTPHQRRMRARFRRQMTYQNGEGQSMFGGMRSLSVAQAIGRLQLEVDRLGAGNQVLSTNLQVRLDGLPRSGQREPDDPGAAVYFALKGKPRCLACDRWIRVADNIAAIAAHVSAIRAVDRYGVGTMDQAFAGYAQLPPSTDEWWSVLGVDRSASTKEIDAAFRALARKHHPDAGGSNQIMARLNQARDTALRSVVIQ